MTYEELLDHVRSFTIRDDAPITAFIARAESNLQTIIRHYLSEKTVKLTVVGGRAVLPSDFREIRQITGTKFYKPVSPVSAILHCDEVGYYREGDAVVFVGIPESEIQLLYLAAFPALTATQSNWLLERFPSVYVAAILREFHRWQVDAEGVQIEQQALNEALALVAEDDRRGRQTGTITMGGGTW